MNTINLGNNPYTLHKDHDNIRFYTNYKCYEMLTALVPGEGLEAVVAPVHEVPHEDVVGVWGRAALSEELLQVVDLAVDIATHRHGAVHGLDVTLLEKEVAHKRTLLLQLILRKIFAVLKG